MDRLLGMGNALVDALARIDNDDMLRELGLPLGAMTLIDSERFLKISNLLSSMPTSMAMGGSACNTVLALGYLGQNPGIIGKVGIDARGEFFRDNCKQHGIEAYLLSDESTPTGVASTFIIPGGQRTFATYLGAAANLTYEDIKPSEFKDYTYFYIEGYLVQSHDLIERAVEVAAQSGLKICIDMASYNIVKADKDFFSYLLPKVNTVFANEEEAEAYTGKDSRHALSALSDICPTVVVKIGKDGAMTVKEGVYAQAPAKDVENVIDTTAAGDFFSAGFLYADAKGASAETCLKAGNVLSGAVIQTIGTTLSQEAWDGIRSELKSLGI